MAIAFDTASPDTSGSGGVSSLTSGAFTLAGTDRVLFGLLMSSAATPPDHSSMKWGGSTGAAMTQQGTTYSLPPYNKSSIWWLGNPAVGPLTLYGSFASASDEAILGGVSYTGVDTATPINGSVVQNSGTVAGATGTMTVTVPTQAGDVVLAFLVTQNDTGAPIGLTAASPALVRYDVPSTTLLYQAAMIVEQVATGTSTTVTINHTGATTDKWVLQAFVVKAAGGGGGGPAVAGVSSSSPAQGSTLVITMTNGSAAQGTGGVTFTSDGVTVAATVTAWSATSISVTVPALKWDAGATFTVTIDGGASASPYALSSIQPISGWAAITILTPNTTAAKRLTSTLDLASTNQVRYNTVGGKVIVYDDGTFSDDGTVSSFAFNVWVTGDGQGAAATQVIQSAPAQRRARLALGSSAISATSRAVGSASAFSASRTESAALSDSSSATQTADASRTESVAITDTSSATGSASVTGTETAALSDTSTQVTEAPVSRTESATLTETSSAVLNASSAATESAALTDASTASLDAVASRTESAGIADASDGVVTGGTLNASATESAGLSDSSTASLSAAATRTESVAATDTSSQTTAAAASVNEVVVPTETSSQTTAASASSSESVAGSDSSSVTQVTMSADRTESAALSEFSTASGAGSYSVVANETASLTDSNTASAAASATRTESAALTDTSAGSTASNASASDSFAIGEVMVAQADHQASHTETAALSEASTTTLSGGAYAASATESVIVADSSSVVSFTAAAEAFEAMQVTDAAIGLRSVFLDHTESGVLSVVAQATLFTIINRPARAIVTLRQRTATMKLLTRKATITLN